MTTANKKRATRALADVGIGTVLATVDIGADPERVFRAITTPEELVRWWGADDAYRTTRWEADLRPGGRWRSEGRGADGQPFALDGEYLEIDPPRRLVQTWKAPWDGGNVTTITWTLAPIASGTRLTVRHEGFGDRAASCEGHAEGWERVLGWLDEDLRPADPRRFFLCRLVPPRPTFAMDMNADEKAMMMSHAAYWRRLLDDGTAVVFGPVADPAGPWGLGVIRAADEAALAALQAADPAIASGRGLRYEVLPMIQAVTRD